METLKEYKVVYTLTAEEDILSKAEYIEKRFRDSQLAYTWYTRLTEQIRKDLSYLPYKFQLYDVGPWKEREVREYIFRNDIVLYSVNESAGEVIIHNVYTSGKDLANET